MPQLWIEYTDENGEVGAARWGCCITNSNIDAVLAAAVSIIGRDPDTVA